MTKTSSFCLAFLLALALVITVGLVYLRGYTPEHKNPEQQQYYQAVYVLQQLDSLAANEIEEIPQAIRHLDSTESLLHNPDRIFVLNELAQEFARLSNTIPRATLYEAYSRMALGERQRAATLLSHFVADSPYNIRHYQLLCSTLQELGDHTSQYLVSTEWLERDTSCTKERLICAWSALYNLQRYREASALMLQDGTCLHWLAVLFAARATMEIDPQKAENMVAQLRKKNTQHQSAISNHWERMKVSSVF